MTNFCPSLMCVDFSQLSHEIQRLESAGAAMFHIDIMDGYFVPNFALGIEDVKAVAKFDLINVTSGQYLGCRLLCNSFENYSKR